MIGLMFVISLSVMGVCLVLSGISTHLRRIADSLERQEGDQ